MFTKRIYLGSAEQGSIFSHIFRTIFAISDKAQQNIGSKLFDTLMVKNIFKNVDFEKK